MSSDCGCSGGFKKLDLTFVPPEAAMQESRIPWPERLVTGWIETEGGRVPKITSEIFAADRLGGFGARWGFNRMDYAVRPGLYAFGLPDAASPVLVTCNYKLTFDRLRSDWKGLNAWVLVLDTKGINVWCAAGKGTFGTEEVVRRIEAVGLSKVVSHREVILPQLGAPGVAGFTVKKLTGFKVTYGPVRAADVPRFLSEGKKAAPEMRKVTFGAWDRLVLTPIELVGAKKSLAYILVLALLISGFGPWGFSAQAALWRGLAFFGAALAGFIGGGVLTPFLLPWIPGRMFAVKGGIIGLLVGGGLAAALAGRYDEPELVAGIFCVAAVSSFAAMNFTGASTYTSQSGVMVEMKRSLPVQIGAAVASVALWIAGPFV